MCFVHCTCFAVLFSFTYCNYSSYARTQNPISFVKWCTTIVIRITWQYMSLSLVFTCVVHYISRPNQRSCHAIPTSSVMMTSSNGNIFPAQRPVTRSLMFSLICTWMNGWVNNREAGDLRRHRAHYDVTLMKNTHGRSPSVARQTPLFLWPKIVQLYPQMSNA